MGLFSSKFAVHLLSYCQFYIRAKIILKLSNILDNTGGNETCFTNATNIFFLILSQHLLVQSQQQK